MNPTVIDGNLLKVLITNGTIALRNDHQRINELNVFPVPDGDTGSNMQSTMMSGVKAISGFEDEGIDKVAKENGMLEVDIPQNHQSLIYVLEGSILVNDTAVLQKGENQMIVFNQDGNSIKFEVKTTSTILILSGEPIQEKVTQYGPYVMNTQTEILEAMRDYQQGKMGYLY